MKTTGRVATLLFSAALALAPAASVAQYYGNGQAPPPPGYQQGPGYNQGGWDQTPSNFRQDVQKRGWRDGMYGARKDLENHRQPNVMNRDEYRNYRGPGRRAYQNAFQRGYNAFWSHQGGGGYGRRY